MDIPNVMTPLSDPKLKLGTNLLRQEIITVGLVLGLVVIAWTLYSVLNPGIDSTDRTVVGAAVLKDMDPSALPRDTLFANDEVYGYYTPLYRWIVAQFWRLGGSFEAGFIWLLPLIMSGYLVSMYLLLRRVSGNYWIALGLTVAAAHYHNVMGASGWGVGSSASLGARTLFMPFAPILILLLLRLLEAPGWAGGAIFGLLLGLITNLHPISGFHFLALASALLMLLHGHRLRGWQALLAIGLATGVGAWPISWHFFSAADRSVGAGVTFESFSRVVAELYALPFSPDAFNWPLFNFTLTRPGLDVLVWLYLFLALVFIGIITYQQYISNNENSWRRSQGEASHSAVSGRRSALNWAWLVGGLITLFYAHLIALFETTFIFMVVGLYLVYRFWRGTFSRLDQWLITFMGLIVLYAFVGYYLFAFVWHKFELWAITSFLTEFARSAAFVYLPLYALAALAGVAWARELARTGFGREADFAVAIAVVFGLAPSAVMHFADSLPLTLLVIGLMLLLGGLVFLIKKNLGPPWNAYLALLVAVLLLFGPLAPGVVNYFPVPAINLFDSANWVQKPLYDPVDAELYDWVEPNTSPDDLFYGCFGPITMTHFRFRTQRSISHNWKDLTFNLHNRATLVPAYERFRKLEAACANFDGVLSAAHALKADYLLISSQEAADFLDQACFANQKYALFTLRSDACVAN